MSVVTMKQLLEAGVHFGHQSKRWNPKMEKYIFTERNGIHIIDLHKTLKKVEESYAIVRDVVLGGKDIIFVGTKKQAQEAVKKEALRCGMHYVNGRWLGGMLTNFKTISGRIKRLKELEKMREDGSFNMLTKREIAKLQKEYDKLVKNLEGIKNMKDLPGIIFIVDTKKELLAISEAKKLNIPIIAMIDTNSDPDEVEHIIPSNDDAIRSITLMSSVMANAVIKAKELEINVQKDDNKEVATKPMVQETQSKVEAEVQGNA